MLIWGYVWHHKLWPIFITLLHPAVHIEQSYRMLGLPTQLFRQEQNRLQALHCCTSLNDSFLEQDLNFMADVGRIERQAPVSKSPFLKLLRLDSLSHLGLPESEFFDLFTMCWQCNWVMTWPMFYNHRCTVVDITDSSGDDWGPLQEEICIAGHHGNKGISICRITLDYL